MRVMGRGLSIDNLGVAHLAQKLCQLGKPEKDFLILQNPRTPIAELSIMKQMTFADAEHAGKRKQTRKELFLIEMDRVMPWKSLIALIAPHYPKWLLVFSA